MALESFFSASSGAGTVVVSARAGCGSACAPAATVGSVLLGFAPWALSSCDAFAPAAVVRSGCGSSIRGASAPAATLELLELGLIGVSAQGAVALGAVLELVLGLVAVELEVVLELVTVDTIARFRASVVELDVLVAEAARGAPALFGSGDQAVSLTHPVPGGSTTLWELP